MKFNEEQIQAAVEAAREKVDATGYGRWVSDDMLHEVVVAVLEAVAASA